MNRVEWTLLQETLCGPRRENEITVTVNGTTVEVESHDGDIDAIVYAHEKATDVRVGRVQILVNADEVVVLVKRGPYPIREWDLLWRGTVR